MSDNNERTLAGHPRAAREQYGDDLHLLEPPPSTGWVVHLVNSTKQGAAETWAWCKVSVDQPGYDEITFTLSDGRTAADPGPGPLQLGAVLVKVWC